MTIMNFIFCFFFFSFSLIILTNYAISNNCTFIKILEQFKSVIDFQILIVNKGILKGYEVMESEEIIKIKENHGKR